MTKSVAILGCGPAGLLAAHAAQLSGWDFRVYSRKQKSQLHGAQYLHKPIPNLPNGEGPKLVKYQMRGTPEGYRRKVYSDDWDGTVSPEDLLEEHYAWDLRAGYNWLWREYSDEIVQFDFSNNTWNAQAELRYIGTNQVVGRAGHDLVISTIPRKVWAEPGDEFLSTKVWALGDAIDTQRVYLYRADEFTVICDGTIDNDWYRVSNIFGYCTMEWPAERSPYGDTFTDLPPARGASIVEKPLSHNSTAASDFIHLGRYGAWEKGVLTSDVFYHAMQVYAKDSINGDIYQ